MDVATLAVGCGECVVSSSVSMFSCVFDGGLDGFWWFDLTS